MNLKLDRTIKIALRLTAITVLGLSVLNAAVSWCNSIDPAGIIIHHSATGYHSTVESIRSAHKFRGFGAFYWGKTYYIGYHYVIFPDGSVIATRPEHLRGAHARGYNSYIGICLIGNFSSEQNPHGAKGLRRPTIDQMHSLYELCDQLRRRYGFRLSEIRRHCDVNKTTQCPGDRFPYQELIAQLSGPSNHAEQTESAPTDTQTHRLPGSAFTSSLD